MCLGVFGFMVWGSECLNEAPSKQLRMWCVTHTTLSTGKLAAVCRETSRDHAVQVRERGIMPLMLQSCNGGFDLKLWQHDDVCGSLQPANPEEVPD